jgi:hypothetical protein
MRISGFPQSLDTVTGLFHAERRGNLLWFQLPAIDRDHKGSAIAMLSFS